MPSILEYAETEFSPLAEKPFTDVDSLLLSQFSYMNLSAFEDELTRLKTSLNAKTK